MLPAAAVSSGAERPSRPMVPSAVRSASWTHGCHWRPGPCRVAALLLGCCLLGAAAGYASVSSGSKEQAGRGRTVALQRKFWQRMRDAMRTGKEPAVAASSDSSETNATDMSLDGKPKLGPRQPNTLTGVFYDESFEVRGSWKGLRVLGGPAGAAPGNGITVLGTDDGSSFYSLRGSFLGDEEVLVDFTPIGGPEYRRGIWTDQAIRWYGVARGMGERDVWTLRPGLLSKMRPLLGSAPLPKRLEGVFTDRKHFIAGTWAGYRFINEVHAALTASPTRPPRDPDGPRGVSADAQFEWLS